MALVTANGAAVISGSIMMPLLGVWTADLYIDRPDGSGFEAGTVVSVKAGDGLSLVGTVVDDRTGSYLDAVHVRLLGGAGGMARAATPKGYAQPGAYVRDVLNQLASDSGETLSSDIAQPLSSKNLVAWTTMQSNVSSALDSLIEIVEPDANWRITPDGKLWVGVETWPVERAQHQVIANDPKERTFDLGVDTFTIVPGIDLEGVGRVNRVEHTISDGGVRSHVWTQIADEDRGMAGAIQALIRQEVAPLDFYAFYDAKIVKQSTDGTTVDLQPSDPRLPGLSNVRLRNGVAGTVCKVAAGAFVSLGWDNGDPTKPYAQTWGGGESVTEINFADGTKGAARVDDPLSASEAMSTWAGVIESLLSGLSAPVPPVSQFSATAGAPGALGSVYQGSTKVKVGG